MRVRIERYLEDLDIGFEEDTWHMALLKSLDGLTAEQAAWAPPGRHSIWQIVHHVALWKEYTAERLAGSPPRPEGWEEKEDWLAVDEVTEEAWRAAVQRLRAAHARLRAEVAARSDEELDRPLPGGRRPLYSTIQAVPKHDSYHCGQIHLLRALQGIATEW
jgi:uncharacterized damage-inducible protein DinB